MLNETKELLSIVSKQKGSHIPAWLAKDASKRLEGTQPNTERAEAVIAKLKTGEMHPALGDKIRKAEKELLAHKQQQQAQPQKRGMRL